MKKTILFLIFLLSFYPYIMASPKLMVTGDMRGEIKPCGCSAEGDLGGIERISTYFNQETNENSKAIWVDLGNFSAEATAQGNLKNRLYEKLFISKKLFALLPGPLEFSKGLLNFRDYKLPYVLTNTKKPIENIQKNRIYKQKIQFFGYLSANLLSHGTHKTKYLTDLEQFILEVKKAVSKKVEKRILLFRGNSEELSRIDQLGIFDLIIPANSAESEEHQKFKLTTNHATFLIPPIKGQGILKLDPEKTTEQQDPEQQIVWLSGKFESDPEWKQDFEQYQKRVEELFFAFLDKEAGAKDKTIYKGAQYCIACHEQEGKIWQASAHAQAWGTLERVKGNFDPDCIPCHSAGFGMGGFLSKELTPALASVQCENCHGIVADHADNKDFKKTRMKVDKRTCKLCHRNSHSPGFSFKKYYSKIKH